MEVKGRAYRVNKSPNWYGPSIRTGLANQMLLLKSSADIYPQVMTMKTAHKNPGHSPHFQHRDNINLPNLISTVTKFLAKTI